MDTENVIFLAVVLGNRIYRVVVDMEERSHVGIKEHAKSFDLVYDISNAVCLTNSVQMSYRHFSHETMMAIFSPLPFTTFETLLAELADYQESHGCVVFGDGTVKNGR